MTIKKTEVLVLKSDEQESVKYSIRKLVKSFNNCKPKHQKAIGETLNCYVDAFDANSFDISFLKAWTALEKITNTDQNEEMIRRSTVLFASVSKPYKKQILEALRIFRNEFIHEGDKGIDPFHACFLVQEYLYNLIVKFNLGYSGFFENIDEANLFLDNYIPDIKELEKRKRIIDKALTIKKTRNANNI